MSIPDLSPHTTQLRAWARRIRAGDEAAGDELIRAVVGRLEALAHRMLRRFPAVRRWEQTGDVLQNALLRLLRALKDVCPESTRRFYGLATEQMRRELLDLARRHGGARGLGANYAAEQGPEPVDELGAPDELERWQAFHEGVASLPSEEREVVGLVFYHGWSQSEVAEAFGVNVRTVQRWWQSALLRLRAQNEVGPGAE